MRSQAEGHSFVVLYLNLLKVNSIVTAAAPMCPLLKLNYLFLFLVMRQLSGSFCHFLTSVEFNSPKSGFVGVCFYVKMSFVIEIT